MRAFCFLLIAITACKSASPASQAGAPPATTTVRVAVSPHETMDLVRDNDVRSIHLSASRDRVWSALMATHDVIGTTPSVLDAGAGSATFIHQNSKRLMGKSLSAYIDCGRSTQGPRADLYNVTIKVSQQVRSESATATTVHTVVSAWAKPMGMSGDAVQCYTLGALERKIGEILQTRLQS
jgi:hypothetical protein